MKALFYVAKMRIEAMIAYNVEVWMYMLMQALTMISVGFFWRAAYGDTAVAYDVTGDSMIAYTVMSTLMGSLFFMIVEEKIIEAVRSGSIATDMIKPVNLFLLYFAEDVGCVIICFILKTIPLFVVASLVFGIPVPASGVHLGMFFLSFVLSYGINWTFSATFAMISFKAISMGPVWSIKLHFINLLSGAIVPIWFFPEWLQSVLWFLPFIHIFQTPLSIYIGKSSIEEGWQNIGIQAIWFVVLLAIFLFAQKKVTKHILVQGG